MQTTPPTQPTQSINSESSDNTVSSISENPPSIPVNNAVADKKPRSSRFLLIFGFALVLLVGIFIGYLLNLSGSNTTTSPVPVTTPTPDSSSNIESSNTAFLPSGVNYVSYISNSESIYNVVIASEDGSVKFSTENSSKGTYYKYPILIDNNHLLYARETTFEGKPTVSVLVIKNLLSGEENVIQTFDTMLNENLAPIGGNIFTMALSPTKDKIAYLVELANESNPDGIKVLQLYNLKTNTTQTLDTVPYSLGRGGTPDDDIGLRFSPNGKHLAFVDTSVAPSTDPINTMFIYEISDTSSTNIYKEGGNEFATFPIFLSSSSFLYKANDIQSLLYMTIDQLQPTYIEKGTAANYRDLMPVSEDVFLSYTTQDNSTSGIQVFTQSITTGVKTNIVKDVVPVGIVGNTFYGRKMIPCYNTEQTCGQYFYNGYEPTEDLVKVNIDTKEVIPLNLPDIYGNYSNPYASFTAL